MDQAWKCTSLLPHSTGYDSTLNWKRNWEMEYSCELPGRRIDMGLSACQLVIPTLLTAVIFQGISWAFISQDFYICKLSLPSLNAFSICLYFCLYLMHFILLVVLLVYHLSCQVESSQKSITVSQLSPTWQEQKNTCLLNDSMNNLCKSLS